MAVKIEKSFTLKFVEARETAAREVGAARRLCREIAAENMPRRYSVLQLIDEVIEELRRA